MVITACQILVTWIETQELRKQMNFPRYIFVDSDFDGKDLADFAEKMTLDNENIERFIHFLLLSPEQDSSAKKYKFTSLNFLAQFENHPNKYC